MNGGALVLIHDVQSYTLYIPASPVAVSSLRLELLWLASAMVRLADNPILLSR